MTRNPETEYLNPGDKVLVIFPITGQPLQARYSGPYEIETRINDVDYVVKTPGRRKSNQLCHINMLKKYVERSDSGSSKPVCTVHVTNDNIDKSEEDNSDVTRDQNTEVKHNEYHMKLNNSDVLANLDQKLGHLAKEQSSEIADLIHEFSDIFSDTPSRTDAAVHEIDVGDAKPIKQHPYRVNPLKMEHLKKEVNYMLDNDIIEPSNSERSSPCLLVPKPDGSYRLVADMRAVNTQSIDRFLPNS